MKLGTMVTKSFWGRNSMPFFLSLIEYKLQNNSQHLIEIWLHKCIGLFVRHIQQLLTWSRITELKNDTQKLFSDHSFCNSTELLWKVSRRLQTREKNWVYREQIRIHNYDWVEWHLSKKWLTAALLWLITI